MKKSVLIFIFAVLPVILFAQLEIIKRDLHKNWQIGVMGGVDYLAFELEKNLKEATMDMNSIPNYDFSFFINKRFAKQYLVGVEYKKNYFSGFKDYSGNIVWLNYDVRFNNENARFVPNPVYYSTHISSFYLNFIYYLPNFYSLHQNVLNLNLYLKAGVGFSMVGVELGYRDYADYGRSGLTYPLYGKGMSSTAPRDSYGTWHLGTGLNYYLSERVSLNAEVMLLFVSNDYLDGVHNYKVIPGTNNIQRIGVTNVVGELKVGVAYHFNLYPGKKFTFPNPWKKAESTFENEYFIDKKYNRVFYNNTPGDRRKRR